MEGKTVSEPEGFDFGDPVTEQPAQFDFGPPVSEERGAGADFVDAFSDAVTLGAGDRVAEEIAAVSEGNRNPAQASDLTDMEAIRFAEAGRDDQLAMLRRKGTSNARDRMRAQTQRLNAQRSERSPIASGAGTAAGVIAPAIASFGTSLAGSLPRAGAAFGEAGTAAKAAAAASARRQAMSGSAQADLFGEAATAGERLGAMAGKTADRVKFDKTILADALGGGGAITGAKTALIAASKAPAGAAAVKAALKSLAARGGPKSSLASVVASGTIGLDRALDDEGFAEALQMEYEAAR